MDIRGQLRIDEAYITGMDFKKGDHQLDYIAVYLESEGFVELIGTNRIRIVFEGCLHAQLELQMGLPAREKVHSFFVKSESSLIQNLADSETDWSSAVHYCLQLENGISSMDVLARTLKVEVEPSTMLRH